MRYKNLVKAFTTSVIMMFLTLIPLQFTHAATLEEQMNNLVGPKQQYNTMLSPAYLRNNTSEESISPQSGNVSIAQSDYVLPGVNGLDLEIKRMYTSGSANVREMKVQYLNGVWVDQVYSDDTTSSFYEDRYNLGIGMRFSFPTIEIKENEDGSDYRYLHTNSGDVYSLGEPIKVDDVNTYPIENQTVKDVTIIESSEFSNGQSDGTSFYRMMNKEGKKTYFAEDGRILGIVDRYNNKITFQYTSQSYTIDGYKKTKKLISKIIDTMGREVTIEYKQDQNFTVGPFQNQKYSLEDSYKSSQNPDTTHSGDLKGNFQVIINLPGNKQIVYDKSAVLVSNTNHVVRTRLQTVYDVDGKPKYHYWYDQPELGFTYTNGTTYSAYNRYENLSQIDHCQTNRIERFSYSTYTKKLSMAGSMQYRKVFDKTELEKTGFDSSKSNFLDAFICNVKDRVTYKYTNEPDGYGTSGYDPSSDSYLKDTYKYYTEKNDYNGTITKYTYNGLQEQISTEETGNNHKKLSVTEYDEMKFPKKTEATLTSLENGQIKGHSVKRIENFRYDMYGNLTSYTGPIAKRDDKGYPVDDENTVVYTYAYNKYHVLTSKTWKQNKDTNSQLIYTVDDKGNVIKEEKVHTSDKSLWIVTDYEYDDYGNMTKKTFHDSGHDYVTNYEYGVDANGVDQKGSYLTKQYGIVGGTEISKKFAYDFNTGSTTAEVDGNGNRTCYEYDDLSRLIKITYADGTNKQYTYSQYPAQNKEILYTDPAGVKFLYRYDIFGNQVEYSVKDKDTWHLLLGDEYDSQGNKIKETDANGNSTRFTFNSENMVVRKDYYEKDTSKKDSTSVGYTYGADSDVFLLVTLTDEDGYLKHICYDAMNRLFKSDETPDKSKYYSSSIEYDYIGNTVSETDAKGNTTHYYFDDTGRLTSKQDASNNETKYIYNSIGKVLSSEEAGGRITAYTYDEMGRMLEERVCDKTSPESYVYIKYSYDKAHNIKTLEQGSFSGGKTAISSYTEYNYDQMNRIVDQFINIDDTRRAHTKFGYNAKGNKSNVTEYINESGSSNITQSFEYDYGDRVIKEEGVMKTETPGDSSAEHGHYIRKSNYDYVGNLLSQELFNGSGYDKTTFKYDYRNRPVEKAEPFTSDGKMKITTYGYDKRGNQTQQTVSCSGTDQTTQYQYNGMGKVASRIDPMGYVSKYLYDENGNLTKEIDPRYSAMDLLEAPGIEYQYDAMNRQIKVSVDDGISTTVVGYKEYDGRGNVTLDVEGEGYNSKKPSESYGSKYQYDVSNNVTKYTSAQTSKDNAQSGKNNHTKEYTYDGSGKVLTETDGLGNITVNKYYTNGLLKQKTYPDGSKESYEYDLTGKFMSVKTDRDGNRTTTYSNIFGKPYRVECPDNTIESMEYSQKGELVKSINKAGDQTYYNYDLLGNMIDKKEFQRSDSTSDYYRHTKSAYDEQGNILNTETFLFKTTKGSITGGYDTSAGDKISYTYDKDSRITKISGPVGRETINGYDKNSNLITKKQKIDDDNYLVTRYKYDVLSRPVEEALLTDTSDLDANYIRNVEFDSEYTSKIKSKTNYTYYLNGQIKSQTNANGNTISYVYDLDKRVITKTDALKNSISYNYDLDGNLREEKNAKGVSTYYEYDSMNRLIRKKTPSAVKDISVTRYIYDVMGNLKKQIEPNNYIKEKDTPELAETMEGMSYTYDSMGRCLTTILPDGSVQEYLKYDAMGNVVKKVDGLRYNGTIETSPGTSYKYNALGNMESETNPLGYTKTYEYNVLGKIIKTIDENGNSTIYVYNPDSTLSKVTYADGASIEYTYNKLGKKTSQKDQRGNGTTYGYNSFGSVKSEKDAYGNSIEYKTDLVGNVVIYKDKRGSLSSVTYDAGNRVVKKKIPLETDGSANVIYSIENYTYDELGNVLTDVLTGTKDKLLSRTKTYTYYDNGLVNTVTDNSGALTRSYYDKNGNIIRKESLRSEGVYDVEKFEYDSMNRLVRDIKLVDEKDINNAESLAAIGSLKDDEYAGKIRLITQYEYDILGNKVKVFSPMAFGYEEDDVESRSNYTNVYSYDLLNRLQKVIRKHEGKEVTVTYDYDKVGNKVTETNERGFETKYTYDKLNRVESITDAEGGTIKNTYDLAGNKLTVINSLGDTVTYSYDKLNRLVTTTDAYGKVINKKVYDANNNVVKEIDAKGYISGDDDSRYGVEYTYDLGNRLVKMVTPEAAAQKKNSIEYIYNQFGEVTRQVDALGNATTYEYDNGGNLTKVTDPLGISTKYTYDKQGDKLTMTDGRGKLTRYGYTSFGNLRSVINSDNKTVLYKYDLAGNAVCIIDKNGNNTIYTYDNIGLLLEKKVSETGDRIKYSYDETGNRISMEDESGISTYTYDGNNRLLEIKKDGSLQISYDYDKVGNVTKITDLKGNTVSYTYDKSNRMETVTAEGKTTTYTYDENGNREAIKYQGGVSEEYTYDRDNHLISLTNKKPDGFTISEYNYKYDLAGRQTSKTDNYGTTTYEYDKDGRVSKVSAPGKTTLYAYDNAGNRVSQNETYTSQQPSDYVDEATGKNIQYILKKSEYTYASSNELLKQVERMFDESNREIARKTTKTVYDDNGNQLNQSVSYTLSDNTKLRTSSKGSAYGDGMSGTIDKMVEKTSYTYDGFNRLKKAETVKDGLRTIAEYKYNGDDLRVSKKVTKSDNSYKEEVTKYLYDRQNVILETDATGNIKTRYIKGINYIASIDSSKKETYFLFNGHGDVVQTVGETGTVQNQYDYDIWGNPNLTIETVACSIRYSGEYMDSETGLYYLRSRYYDPYTGRFTSEDTYRGQDENPLSVNLYTYCTNDPIQFVDPSGHDKVLSQTAAVSIWDSSKSRSTFTINGVTKDFYVEKDGKVYDSNGYVAGSLVNGHVSISDSAYNNIFGSSSSNTSPSNITLNVAEGKNYTSVVTGNGANVIINNSGNIGLIQTGANSNTTVNNYSIIDTISTGNSSTASIFNSESGIIRKITGGKDSSLNITNSGYIEEIHTGENSRNKVLNLGDGLIWLIQTGLNNTTEVSDDGSIIYAGGDGKLVNPDETPYIGAGNGLPSFGLLAMSDKERDELMKEKNKKKLKRTIGMYDRNGKYIDVPYEQILDKLENGGWRFANQVAGKEWLIEQSKNGVFYKRFIDMRKKDHTANFMYGTQPELDWITYKTYLPVGEIPLTEEEFINFMGPIWILHAMNSTWKDDVKELFTGLSFAALTVFAPMVLGKVLEWAIEATTVSEMSNTAGIRAYLKTGAYDPELSISIGNGLGKLNGKSINVTTKGLNLVKNHVAQFGDLPENTAMIKRIESALKNGKPITSADASFYMHEAAEATMMQEGIPYEVAHEAVLKKYNVSPYSVYHPGVIQQFSEWFNQGFKNFWGLK